MADNIDVTPGSGKTVSTDEVTIDGALVQVQRIKPTWGVAGSAVDTSASNPLPVAQTGALPAGTAVVGKVGIDQTTPGTTNGVSATGNVAHDAVDSGAPVKVGGKGNSGAPTPVSANGDRVDLALDLYGHMKALVVDSTGTVIDQTATVNVAQDTAVIKNGAASLTPKFAKISLSATGDPIAAVSGKKLRILAYNMMGAGAVNAKFQSGGSTDLTGLKYIAGAGGGICAPFNPVGWFETLSGEKLTLNLSASVGVGGEITYVEV